MEDYCQCGEACMKVLKNNIIKTVILFVRIDISSTGYIDDVNIYTSLTE